MFHENIRFLDQSAWYFVLAILGYWYINSVKRAYDHLQALRVPLAIKSTAHQAIEKWEKILAIGSTAFGFLILFAMSMFPSISLLFALVAIRVTEYATVRICKHAGDLTRLQRAS